MRPAGALAVATFASLQKASQACQRLDGATFKGAKLACRFEAHVDRSHDQKGRFVVRNLHFRAVGRGPVGCVHGVRAAARGARAARR